MMQQIPIDDLLVAARQNGFISAAHFQQLPDGFPFYVAVSAIDLPDGCVAPDNTAKRRVAVGKDKDKGKAGFLAQMEAAERYSIQFGNDLPERYSPFRSFGAEPCEQDVSKLTIAAPTTNGEVRSIGAAAGHDLDDAARRAVLELLEHHHIDTQGFSPPGWHHVRAGDVPGIADLSNWVDGQLRVLDCRYRWYETGYAVAICDCRDFGGGRRILGHSARTSLVAAISNAVSEAIFHWRNMIALEFHGRPASAFSGYDLELFETYRGYRAMEPWQETKAEAFADAGPSGADIHDLVGAYTKATGQALHFFDFTHPKLGIPVVRAVPGPADPAYALR